jgi:hypothetical protein
VSRREGALAQASPRWKFVQIALALVALVATLIPDVRGLPTIGRSPDLLSALYSDPSPEAARGPVSSVSGCFEEVDEDPDGPKSRALIGSGCDAPRGGGPRFAAALKLPATRGFAHQATGPPLL